MRRPAPGAEDESIFPRLEIINARVDAAVEAKGWAEALAPPGEGLLLYNSMGPEILKRPPSQGLHLARMAKLYFSQGDDKQGIAAAERATTCPSPLYGKGHSVIKELARQACLAQMELAHKLH